MNNEIMLIDENIIKCELGYVRQFGSEYEDENIIRFRHLEIRDMYSHNVTYIKKKEKELKIRSLIEEEIAVCLREKADFCNVIANSSVHPRVLSYIKYPSILTINGFYQFNLNKKYLLEEKVDINMKKIDNVEMFDEMLRIDLDADEKYIGKEFCVRRCYGKSAVYLTEGCLDAYLCYYEDELVGRCDLFIQDGVAKIEDLNIMERYHNMGYGSSLLKIMIEIAIEKKCHTIYLVTDESDTPKEMYKKLGFAKIGEMTEIRFQLA